MAGLLDVIKGARGMARRCGEQMATEDSGNGVEGRGGGGWRDDRVSLLQETQKGIILSAGQMVTNTSGLISVTRALNENRFGGNTAAIANAKEVCRTKVKAILEAIVTLLSTLKQLAGMLS